MNLNKINIIINVFIFISLSLLLAREFSEKKIDFSPVLNEISNAKNNLNDSLNYSLNTSSKDQGKHLNEVVNKIKDLENGNFQTKNDVLNYLKSNLDFKENIEKIAIEVSNNGITLEERERLFREIKRVEGGLKTIDEFTKTIGYVPVVIDEKGIKKVGDLGQEAKITDPTMQRIANKVVEVLKHPSNSSDPKIQDDKNKTFADLLLKSIIKANENLAKNISLSKDQQLQFTKNAQKDEQIINLTSELKELKLNLKNEKSIFKGNNGNIAILLTNSTEFKITNGLLACILETAEKQNLSMNKLRFFAQEIVLFLALFNVHIIVSIIHRVLHVFLVSN